MHSAKGTIIVVFHPRREQGYFFLRRMDRVFSVFVFVLGVVSFGIFVFVCLLCCSLFWTRGQFLHTGACIRTCTVFDMNDAVLVTHLDMWEINTKCWPCFALVFPSHTVQWKTIGTTSKSILICSIWVSGPIDVSNKFVKGGLASRNVLLIRSPQWYCASKSRAKI